MNNHRSYLRRPTRCPHGFMSDLQSVVDGTCGSCVSGDRHVCRSNAEHNEQAVKAAGGVAGWAVQERRESGGAEAIGAAAAVRKAAQNAEALRVLKTTARWATQLRALKHALAVAGGSAPCNLFMVLVTAFYFEHQWSHVGLQDMVINIAYMTVLLCALCGIVAFMIKKRPARRRGMIK